MGVASQPCGHFLASRCGRTADHAALGSVRRGGAEAAGRSVSALICRPPARRSPSRTSSFPQPYSEPWEPPPQTSYGVCPWWEA